MPRYAPRCRRPRMSGYDDFGDWSSDEIRHGSIDVHEPQRKPEETGLFDHLGNELMRLPEERRPIGFLHAYEADE